jgi:hypothetical protein
VTFPAIANKPLRRNYRQQDECYLFNASFHHQEAMSKGYKNLASEVAYFIDFNFTIFAMFKTTVLLALKLSIAQL